LGFSSGGTTLLLLDLDGTLVDSRPGIHRCTDLALAEHGRPPIDPALLPSFIGPPLRESFALLGLDGSDLDDVVAAYRRHYEQSGLIDFTVFPGIPEALVAIRASGVRLAVATSKITAFAQRIVDLAGLAPLVDLVLGAELDGRRHHKSDVIGDVLALLGTHDSSSTFILGDRRFDGEGGALHDVGFLGALWGYGSADELRTAGAIVLVETPFDLPDAVARVTPSDRWSQLA
jgi:phosphoglycolate phosphatase